jgi:DNA-binding XRE family transcriptional regulator
MTQAMIGISRIKAMDSKKRTQLENSGWVSTTVEEFLGLSSEEIAYINLKLYLASIVKSQRKDRKFTQQTLATLMGSSQSRIAKMENGDPSVSLDLLFRALMYLGISKGQLAQIINNFEPLSHVDPVTYDKLSGPEE